MTKATVMEIIREAANKHGFEFEQIGNFQQITDGKDWSKSWVNFTITEKAEWNDGTIDVRVTVSAATARMGGSQTAEDLRKAAETISRAADLVVELENKELVYTVEL